jgi:hypothetical protein
MLQAERQKVGQEPERQTGCYSKPKSIQMNGTIAPSRIRKPFESPSQHVCETTVVVTEIATNVTLRIFPVTAVSPTVEQLRSQFQVVTTNIIVISEPFSGGQV